MHHHQVLVFTALLIFVFGLFSRVSERWTITGPMVFMIVGIAVSPLGFGMFEVHPTGDLVKLVAEITLILILFVDGSLIDIKALRRDTAIFAVCRSAACQRFNRYGASLRLTPGSPTCW